MKTSRIINILAPSWLSGLVAITVALIISVGSIALLSFNNSQIHQQIVGFQITSPAPALTLPGQQPPGGDSNSLQTTWPLLAFWAMVGLAAYIVVDFIIKVTQEVVEVRHELNYVNTKRDIWLRFITESLLLRLAALITWLLFINFFFKAIVPYSIDAAHAALGAQNFMVSCLFGLLSFAVIAVSLHIHTIFFRLASGRARLF